MSDPASAAPSRRRRWDLPGDSAPPADATSDPAAIENAKRLAMERARALAASASVSLLSSGASGSAPRNGADGAGDDDFGAIVPAGQNFTFDVEINDCRNRYNLTKSTSQHEIKNQTGCEITTRGKYYPDKSKATALDPPLHLHLSATSKEALDSAVARIKDIMEQQPDPLLEQRTSFLARPGGRDSDEQGGGDTGRGRGNMQPLLTDKIVIDFGQDRYFNVRSKIIGPRGLYVKHIQAETNVRLQLKGQGSGFCENATGRESDEPLHVHMQTTVGEAALEKARTLLVDLLAQVRSDYEKWKTGRTQGGGGDFRGGDGFRNGPPGGGDGFDRDRDRPPMQQMPPMQQHDRYGAPPSSSYGAPGGGYPGGPPPQSMGPGGGGMMMPMGPGGAAVNAEPVLPVPPIPAPTPAPEIVKSADDMVKYQNWYGMFFAYYMQLANAGQPLPVVTAPVVASSAPAATAVAVAAPAVAPTATTGAGDDAATSHPNWGPMVDYYIKYYEAYGLDAATARAHAETAARDAIASGSAAGAAAATQDGGDQEAGSNATTDQHPTASTSEEEEASNAAWAAYYQQQADAAAAASTVDQGNGDASHQ